VPQEEGPDLDAYVSNLERVARALEQAHSTYAAALAEYADLSDRAERLASTLAGCGAPTSVDLAGMLTAAKECLHTRPADIRRAAALVAAQEAYLGELRTGS
jgi:ABC-type transporter Mla subunit MlaD